MCDPMWHVSSRSGTLVTYLLSYSIHKCRTCIVCPLGTSYRTALPKRMNWSSAVKVADWRRPKQPCTRCDYMHTGATWRVWWTNCAAAAMHAVAVISVVTCLGLVTYSTYTHDSSSTDERKYRCTYLCFIDVNFDHCYVLIDLLQLLSTICGCYSLITTFWSQPSVLVSRVWSRLAWARP